MMTLVEIMARSVGARPQQNKNCDVEYLLSVEALERFAELVRADERERICKAIKEEDDYCVSEGDYMLDSDDCIAIAKGEWVRPDYNVDAIRARGNT